MSDKVKSLTGRTALGDMPETLACRSRHLLLVGDADRRLHHHLVFLSGYVCRLVRAVETGQDRQVYRLASAPDDVMGDLQVLLHNFIKT